MALNERAFWAAPIGLNPAGLSVNDVKLKALRLATASPMASINEAEREFYADRLGISPAGKTINDLELAYYRNLGLTGSIMDCRRKFLKGSMSAAWVWSA